MLHFLQKVICQLASWVRSMSFHSPILLGCCQLWISTQSLSFVPGWDVQDVWQLQHCWARCSNHCPVCVPVQLSCSPPPSPLTLPYSKKSKTPGWPTWTCISFSATCISERLFEDEWMPVTHLQTDCPGVVYASIWGVAPSSPKASWETMVRPNWLCFLLTLQTKEDQMQVIGNLKNISMASSKLLLAAKSLSVDPGAPNAKNLLAAAAR